jgi:heptosyltransferase-2
MKILIVAPAWVGDMVMAHSLVGILQRDPEVSVDVLAPPATAALAGRMPGVGNTHTLAVGHGELGWRRRRQMGAVLAKENYDQAIVLPNSFKSALVPYWSRIPRRTGWTGESRFGILNDRRRLDPDRYPLMIERFMALGLPPGEPLERPYPLPRLETNEERAEYLRRTLGLASAGITVLCPGAEFGPAKRWPAEHFAAVARSETERGREVWLLGSPGDVEAARDIEGQVPGGVVNLAGRTSLEDAVDLIGLADRVVCNDSGLMHVAGALQRETYALFGSTSPAFTPPLGEHSRVIRHSIACSPCFQRECPLGHMKCLRDLAPERVIERF